MPDVATSMTTPAAIGRYHVRTRLAHDEVGEIFRGFDPLIQRPVIIRVFYWPGARPNETQAIALQFFEEVQHIGVLVHPGIVPLFDAGECASGLFMASEFIEGSSVAALVADAGPRDLERALAAAVQLAEAIDYAHSQGVTHRNLKPTNVRITPDAMVRVAGFGVTAVVEAIRGPGALPATLYRAPECDAGRAGDRRADVYAFGALLVDLLSELRATDRGGRSQTPLPSVLAERGASPDAWARLVGRALADDPAARFPTAQNLLNEVAAIAGVALPSGGPVWEALSLLGSTPESDADRSDTSTSSTGIAAVSPHHGSESETVAHDAPRASGRDDDLTLTKM